MTALLVVGGVAAYLILTKQQAVIGQLQDASDVPAAVPTTALATEPVEASDAPPAAIAGWAMQGVDDGACGAAFGGPHRIAALRDDAAPISIALPENYAFALDATRTTSERAVLRGWPCGTEVLGPHPLRNASEMKFWTVHRDTLTPMPLSAAEYLDCPTSLRGAFIGGEALSFCYPNEWGATTTQQTLVAPEHRTGDLFALEFASAKGIRIEAATPDFAYREPQAPIIPHRFDLTRSDDELHTEFSAFGTIQSFNRITIDGKPGIRLHITQTFDADETYAEYLVIIPDAIANVGTTYDLSIRGTSDLAPLLDAIVATMRFTTTTPH